MATCDPHILLKLAQNDKQRMAQVTEVIGLIRVFKKEQRDYVHNDGYRGMRHLVHFDRVKFARSFETIKDFCVSQTPLKTCIAVLVNRSL